MSNSNIRAGGSQQQQQHQQQQQQMQQIAGLDVLMRELGYSATASLKTMRATLEHASQTLAALGKGTSSNGINAVATDESVARVIIMMCRTHSGLDSTNTSNEVALAVFRGIMSSSPSSSSPSSSSSAMMDELNALKGMVQTWDVNVFILAVLDMNPKLDLFNVLRLLDQPDFLVLDGQGIGLICTAFKTALKDIYKFPINIFCSGRWNNPRAQFSFLKNAVLVAPELFGLPGAGRRVLSDANPALLKALPQSFLSQAWNSQDLIETLLILAEVPEIADEVKNFLDVSSQQSPELFVLGVAGITSPWTLLHKELASNLVLLFLVGHPNSGFVLPLLWQVSQSLCLIGLFHMYSKDPSTLSRILDIAQEMKALAQILEAKSFPFCIDLAALASRRDYLNLEKWLQDRIRVDGNLFVKACVEFLRGKVALQLMRQQDANAAQNVVPLSVNVVAVFIRILQNTMMSPENSDYLKELLPICLQAYPRLSSVMASPDEVLPSSETTTTFSADVDEEVRSYYTRMYLGELSVSQVVELLRRYRDYTPGQREHEVYTVFNQILFEEYQFFPKYPDDVLNTASVLFGSLIQNVYMDPRTLASSLRFVLEALRQPVGSKYAKFGTVALMQFQSRLAEWPHFCSLVLGIQHMHQTHPELMMMIKGLEARAAAAAAAAGEQTQDGGGAARTDSIKAGRGGDGGGGVDAESLNGGTTNGGGPGKSSESSATPVFTAVKPNMLLETSDKHEAPNETTSDRILFLMNNMTFDNLDSKAAEMKDILREVHFRWFSHYLVVKRSSIEPNFHELYIALLDSLKSKSLYQHVLHETYSNIRVLVNSDKTVTSSSERSLLNNLGIWLGGITLMKNLPIKHKNLSFKDLLLEGFDSDRLIVVIPFVCKVMETCVASKVFKPPNPWLMAIMKLLSELYHFAELKMNLQLPVIILCKKLGLDIEEIEPTTIVRNRSIRQADARPGQAVAVTKDSTRNQAPANGNVNQQPEPAHQNNPVNQESFNPISLQIHLNPKLAIPPAMRRIVQISIERAIREIISPVVERSVTIAGIATKELIVKDFALEPNEDRMRKAAHLMIQNLAGNLAAVSSREPLRISMMSQLRNLLLQNGFTEQSVPEEVVYTIVGDNLDLACSMMEKAAAEKAVSDIDEILAGGYNLRRKHREQRISQPFYDVSIYAASRYPSSLPELLRLKPGGLSINQLRLYEDFSRVPRASEQVQRPPQRPEGMYSAQAQSEDSGQITSAQILEKFAATLNELDAQIASLPETSLMALAPQSDIRNILRQIVIFLPTCREEFLMAISQKFVQQLFQIESHLSRECYIILLEKTFDFSKRVAREFSNWLLYANDPRKYNIPVYILLMKMRMIALPELDVQLSRLIAEGNLLIAEFTTHLIRSAIQDPPIVAHESFFNSIDALSKLVEQGKGNEGLSEFVREMNRRFLILSPKDALSKDSDAILRERLRVLFTEWVKLYHHPSTSEQAHAAFVARLQQQGILQGETVASLFFRICTELSMDSYIKAKATPGSPPSACFEAVDAFARLIVLLVRYYSEPSAIAPKDAKLNLTTKILSIIVLVLVHSHEQRRGHFNQRPFFRLFSTLLHDLNLYEDHLQPLYFQILSAISNTFHTLQPTFLPGFTFSWLQLVSHRYFMPKLLLAESGSQKGWPFFQRLLVDLFKFMSPYLKQTEMSDTTRLLYKATLRILLVLLHDFPEFLCDYHFSFVDVIPHSCIQLRNLILSAFPSNMRLPDPLTPNLKVDLLPEINQPPHVLSDYTSSLIPNNFKADIDVYLKSRGPVTFLLDLRSRLLLPPSMQTEGHSKYNIGAINSLVLYVGIQAISQVQNNPSQGGLTSPITHSAPIDIFQQLMADLDTEGRYLFLSGIANQLRYPNSHTHYFSCVLLYLFSEASKEVIQEQITRVLIERLIVNRPHPYGLLITFIELIRNPRYNFWEHTNFIRCAPEIEVLFTSVAKSIHTSSLARA